jgi:CHAD domain-containing protein
MAHATTTIPAVLAAALTRQQRAFARRIGAAIGGHPAAVHRARVASRRLREVVAVAAVAAPASHAERLGRDVRRWTRALGPVRELDVALEELAAAAGRHAWSDGQTAVVGRRIEERRDRRRAKLAARAGDRPREWFGRRVRALAARLASVAESQWWEALTRRVARRAGRVAAAADACGTLYVPERLHDLRIAVKKLRYALELVPEVAGLDAKGALATLRRAQRRFGHLHDVQILLGEVQALDVGRRRSVDRESVRDLIEALERECREIHARSLALIPRVAARARDLSRDLAARRRGRRLTMAKASAAGPVGRRSEPGARAVSH